MASPNASQIASTTIESRTGMLADNVTKNNALLKKLREKGKIKTVSGGRVIYQELEYAENSSFKRFSGLETLDTTQSQIISAAEYNFAQASVAVIMSGLERMQNHGKEATINLLEAKISNAEKTLVNNIARDCYSDGTADGGRQIGGLALLVPDDPTTGIAGGINRATAGNEFWRSFKYSALTDGGAAADAANIQDYMQTVLLNISRGTDMPDMIVTDNNYYKLFWQSMIAIQRVASDSKATAGFSSLAFANNIPVIYDGGIGGGATANHMWFLNTDYIFLRPSSIMNFEPTAQRQSVNQDATIQYTLWGGNMTMSNASLQGVLIA